MSFRYDAVDPPRVLVTRAAEDAGHLAHALGRSGFEPVVVPLLERHWHADAVCAAARDEPEADWVLVTSATAADVVATGAPDAWRKARWAAVGKGTAARLGQLGYRVHHVPTRATAAHLVASLGDLSGATVVYPRADIANPKTTRMLEDAGARVVDILAYVNVPPDGYERRLRASIPVHATTLLSGSAAARLAAAVVDHRERLGRIVCIGPSTERVARAEGLDIAAVADPHSVAGVIDALVQLFSR